MNALQAVEQAVLEEGREWMRLRLEQRLQAAADAVASVDTRSGRPLQDVRRRALPLRTVAGEVCIQVDYGRSPTSGAWIHPVREAWGLGRTERVSPELQARLCHTVTVVGSYEAAAGVARCWGSPVSDDLIHALVQRRGSEVAELVRATAPAPPRPFSLVIMMDGWMARERGPDWGRSRRRHRSERVCWHEIKSSVIYQLHHRAESAGGRGLLIEKFVVATPPDTPPVDFGEAVHAEALRRGLATAEHVYLVMDGAVWLWVLSDERFASATKILDFHHAREHLQSIATALHGEGTDAARNWFEPLVHQLRHGGETRVLRRLEELLVQPPLTEPASQATVVREVQYFRNHADHIHYRKTAKAGAPIGSGAVESLGAQLQRRLRSCGQFWRRQGLTNLLALCVIFKNRDDPLLWN
jgi:hypothetical protein